jgi:hypothetical protein
MNRHSAPLLLVLGVLVAWASIRTTIVLADETGARRTGAKRPLLAAPRARPQSIRVTSPDPQLWTNIETSPAIGWRNREKGTADNRRSSASRHAEATIGSSSGVVRLAPVTDIGPAEAVTAMRPTPVIPLTHDQRPRQIVTQTSARSADDHASPAAKKWSRSAWAYVRPDMARGPRFDLARLGGSQIGLRVARRMDRSGQASLFARIVSSGAIGDGLEGAAGLTFQPSHSVPVALVIERREQLAGTGGRSAFAAYATGGASNVSLSQGWTLDAYGAAGVVGGARRDPFGEGSAVVARRLTSVAGVDVEAGVGAWGAAQPGATRLDVGPRLSARLPIGNARPLLAIDWRQRVAGDAAPASGVALTLAADF